MSKEDIESLKTTKCPYCAKMADPKLWVFIADQFGFWELRCKACGLHYRLPSREEQ